MAALDRRECPAEMEGRETRGTRDRLVFRARREQKETVEPPDFLDNQVYQVSTASKERWDCKVYLASLASKAKLEGLDTKASWETEGSLEIKVMKAPLAPLVPTPLSRETLVSQALRGLADPRGHRASLDSKDSKV